MTLHPLRVRVSMSAKTDMLEQTGSACAGFGAVGHASSGSAGAGADVGAADERVHRGPEPAVRRGDRQGQQAVPAARVWRNEHAAGTISLLIRAPDAAHLLLCKAVLSVKFHLVRSTCSSDFTAFGLCIGFRVFGLCHDCRVNGLWRCLGHWHWRWGRCRSRRR